MRRSNQNHFLRQSRKDSPHTGWRAESEELAMQERRKTSMTVFSRHGTRADKASLTLDHWIIDFPFGKRQANMRPTRRKPIWGRPLKPS